MPSPAPALHRPIWSRIFRIALNFWPCIRGSGGRITHLSPDFTQLRVKLPLNWRTRNRVGTIYGGSMASATDPFFMLMLMELLGKDYVVWDKAVALRFRRPAKETLTIDFKITPEMLAEVHEAVAARGEHSFTWKIEFKSAKGTLHAEADKTLYVATREHYREKLIRRAT